MSRGRPSNILRPVKLTTVLPEDVRARLDLYLYSDVEGRVPHGAYSQFIADRVREFFEPTKYVDKQQLLRAMRFVDSDRNMDDVEWFLSEGQK